MKDEENAQKFKIDHIDIENSPFKNTLKLDLFKALKTNNNPKVINSKKNNFFFKPKFQKNTEEGEKEIIEKEIQIRSLRVTKKDYFKKIDRKKPSLGGLYVLNEENQASDDRDLIKMKEELDRLFQGKSV